MLLKISWVKNYFEKREKLLFGEVGFFKKRVFLGFLKIGESSLYGRLIAWGLLLGKEIGQKC
jgi:hypothetical protein